MSASSCASFTIRQPAVIGVPLTTVTPGTCAAPSANTKRTVSSAAIVAVDSPREASPFRSSSYGFSCSSQAITSASRPSGPRRACSIARSSSNLGVIKNAAPFTGITAASSRSLSPHLMPVKYSMLVPPVSMRASIRWSRMSCRAFSRRPWRSATEMGTTPSRIGRSARMAGGSAAGGCAPAVAGTETTAPAARAVADPRKSRRDGMADSDRKMVRTVVRLIALVQSNVESLCPTGFQGGQLHPGPRRFQQ